MNIIEAARLIKDGKLVTRKKWKNMSFYDEQDEFTSMLNFIKDAVEYETYWDNYATLDDYLTNHVENLLAEDWEEIK